MDRLTDLIKQSRHWASVDRGLTLFKLVAEFFQDVLKIDAGLFIYKKQFMIEEKQSAFKVYQPWGLGCSLVELETCLDPNSLLLSDSRLSLPEEWTPIDQIPEVWRRIWDESVVQFVGSWPLIVKEKVVGCVVLGHRQVPNAADAKFMSLCSTYISFVAEMLMLRRIAEFHSVHEPLTGLLNRRGFENQLRQLSSSGDSNKVLLIGILDINDFKSINDSYGHIKGDIVLQEVAAVLNDFVSSDGICARFGGDEFVFAIRSSTRSPDHVSKQILSLFSDKKYGISLGCAVCDKNTTDWTSCLDLADKRLYTGKASGTT